MKKKAIISIIILVLSISLVSFIHPDGIPTVKANPYSDTFITSASDGHLTNVSYPADGTDYWDIWNATDALHIRDTQAHIYIGQDNDSVHDIIGRAFLFFDTSSIPDDVTITSVKLNLYGRQLYDDQTPDDFDIVVQIGQTTTYPHNPLIASDYDRSLYSGDGGSMNTAYWDNTSWNTIDLNSNGISWVNKEGWTKFCLRSSLDISGVRPPSGWYNNDVYFYSREGDVNRAPRLIVSNDADNVDEQQVICTDSVGMGYSTEWEAQSFIPDMDWTTRTKLYFEHRYENESVTLTVSIRAVLDEGSDLTVTSVTDPLAWGDSGWVEFDYADAELISGNTYYIVVRETGDGGSLANYYLYYNCSDFYLDGQAYDGIVNGGETWTPTGDCDLCFKEYGYYNPNTPSTPSGAASGRPDVSYDFQTSTTDPDGDDVKYGWDWTGDDAVDEWTGFYASGATCTTPHSWASVGGYHLKVKAEDTYGDQSGWSDTHYINIYNTAPTALLPSVDKTYVQVGETIHISTTATDPDSDKVKVNFDYGDSSTSGYFPATYQPSGSTFEKDYYYSSTGTYHIKARAKDEYELAGGWSSGKTITVYGIVNYTTFGGKVETTYAPLAPPNLYLKFDGTNINNTYLNIDIYHPINLTWSGAEGAIDYYKIYQKNGSGNWWYRNFTTKTYHLISTLTQGKFYWNVTVYNITEDNESIASNNVMLTIDTTGPTITTFGVTISTKTATINWVVDDTNFANVTLRIWETGYSDLVDDIYNNKSKTVSETPGFEYGHSYNFKITVKDLADNEKEEITSKTVSAGENASAEEPELVTVWFHKTYLLKGGSVGVTIKFNDKYNISSLVVKEDTRELDEFNRYKKYIYNSTWTPESSGDVDFYIKAIDSEGGVTTITIDLVILSTKPTTTPNPSVKLIEYEDLILPVVFSESELDCSAYEASDIYHLSFGKEANKTVIIDISSLTAKTFEYKFLGFHISFLDYKAIKLEVHGITEKVNYKVSSSNYKYIVDYDRWFYQKYFGWWQSYEKVEEVTDSLTVSSSKTSIEVRYR